MELQVSTTMNQVDSFSEVITEVEELLKEKLNDFSSQIDDDKPIQVKVEEVKLLYRLQIMFSSNGMVIRADVKESSPKRAVNRAINKIKKKLGKIEYRDSLDFSQNFGRLSNEEEYDDEFIDTDSPIKRRKAFSIKPMTESEALLQMELLGHEFFMFYNGEIDNMCLLYKRREGDFGLIEAVS